MKKQFFYIALMILFVSTAGIAQQGQQIIYTNTPQQFDQYKMMPANQVSSGRQPAVDPSVEIQKYMLAKVDENIHRNFGSDYEKVVQKNPLPISAAKYDKYMYAVGLPGQTGELIWTPIPLQSNDMILVYDGTPYAIQTQIMIGREKSVPVWAPLYIDKENAVKVKTFNEKRVKNLRQQMLAANPQLAMERESNSGQGWMIGAAIFTNIGLPILQRVMDVSYMKAVARAQNTGNGNQATYQNPGQYYNTGGGGNINNIVYIAPPGSIQRTN